jgi:hypothetical protein
MFHFWEYIHNWDPDICIGFSLALHLQCGGKFATDGVGDTYGAP